MGAAEHSTRSHCQSTRKAVKDQVGSRRIKKSLKEVVWLQHEVVALRVRGSLDRHHLNASVTLLPLFVIFAAENMVPRLLVSIFRNAKRNGLHKKATNPNMSDGQCQKLHLMWMTLRSNLDRSSKVMPWTSTTKQHLTTTMTKYLRNAKVVVAHSILRAS